MQKLVSRQYRYAQGVDVSSARTLAGKKKGDPRGRGELGRVCCRGNENENENANASDRRPGTLSSADLFSHSGHSMPGVVCYRKPSPFLPPTRAIEAQMNALQSNDWPEDGSGIESAFQFSWPNNAEQILPGEVNLSLRKSWKSFGDDEGESRNPCWCTLKEFREQISSSPYSFLLHCESWEVLSDLRFTDKEGLHAYQTVKVNVNVSKSTTSHHYYTFHMKQIGRGSLKGFWMTDEVSYHSSL